MKWIPLLQVSLTLMERIGMGLDLDNDENGYVNHGDSITIYSPDTTDLYFTCVELHDTYE